MNNIPASRSGPTSPTGSSGKQPFFSDSRRVSQSKPGLSGYTERWAGPVKNTSSAVIVNKAELYPPVEVQLVHTGASRSLKSSLLEAKESPSTLNPIQAKHNSPRTINAHREIHVGVGGISYPTNQPAIQEENSDLAKATDYRAGQYSRVEAHIYEGPPLSSSRHRGERDSLTANHISDRLASERGHQSPPGFFGVGNTPNHAATARPAYRLDKYSSDSARYAVPQPEVELVEAPEPQPQETHSEEDDQAILNMRSLVLRVKYTHLRSSTHSRNSKSERPARSGIMKKYSTVKALKKLQKSSRTCLLL